MKKPRIRKFGDSWVCVSPRDYVGFGDTPMKAYNNWLRVNMFVGKVGLA